jgi:hypothetical protein
MGPISADADGLIVCNTQRQAQNLLKIGHPTFTAKWEEVPIPEWATKFVVYVRRQGKLIWNPREES